VRMVRLAFSCFQILIRVFSRRSSILELQTTCCQEGPGKPGAAPRTAAATNHAHSPRAQTIYESGWDPGRGNFDFDAGSPSYKMPIRANEIGTQTRLALVKGQLRFPLDLAGRSTQQSPRFPVIDSSTNASHPSCNFNVPGMKGHQLLMGKDGDVHLKSPDPFFEMRSPSRRIGRSARIQSRINQGAGTCSCPTPADSATSTASPTESPPFLFPQQKWLLGLRRLWL
jgi:hypothetical protein